MTLISCNSVRSAISIIFIETFQFCKRFSSFSHCGQILLCTKSRDFLSDREDICACPDLSFGHLDCCHGDNSFMTVNVYYYDYLMIFYDSCHSTLALL